MIPLVPLPTPHYLLSFDFDGTLHDPAQVPPVPRAFFDWIRCEREERGLVWGINTGRSLAQMREGFRESSFPFLPDWVVACEREIYFSNHGGEWVADGEWNGRCEREIQDLFRRSRQVLSQVRREVEEHTGAQWIEMDGDPAGIISRTVEEMEWIVSHITPMLAGEPDFSWQRNSIYLRFGHRDFQKGSSLCRVAGHYGLEISRCFAIGDSHNDLEMLDRGCAGMIACPSNAVAEVVDKVRAQGGFVSGESYGLGAVEALRKYFG